MKCIIEYELKYYANGIRPEILASAVNDRIHETSGKLLKCRAAKTVKVKKIK